VKLGLIVVTPSQNHQDILSPDMMIHTSTPNTGEVEAGCLCEFKASLVYIASFRSSRATQCQSCLTPLSPFHSPSLCVYTHTHTHTHTHTQNTQTHTETDRQTHRQTDRHTHTHTHTHTQNIQLNPQPGKKSNLSYSEANHLAAEPHFSPLHRPK
jgi:hypothetical protein